MAARLSTWVLAGALLASVVVHVIQWSHGTLARAAPEPPALVLSPQQIDRLSSCCATSCTERQDLMREIASVEADLRDTLTAPAIDRARATRLAEQLGALRARCLRNSVESISLVRDVLTPEQVEALVKCFREGCVVETRE